jgi:plasmid stabilization system protein ParE
MIFTVVWIPKAEAMLARIWNAAKDRNAVAKAADRIDELLKRNP